MESYGNPHIEVAVTAGGGEYRGVQRGSQQKGIPDLILFNDPLTGTTLALVANATLITPQMVRAKIGRSRADFAKYGRLDPNEIQHCAATRDKVWHETFATDEVEDHK